MRYLLFLLISLISCDYQTKKAESTADDRNEYIQYASGFSIQKTGEIFRLVIKRPSQHSSTSIVYWLLPREMEVPDSLREENVIKIPLRNIVVTSTSHIPMLNYLGETEALVGFPTLDLISSEAVRTRIEEGLVAELGRDNALNFEMLVKLNPDLVMNYSLNPDNTQVDRIKNAGIPVLINADYLEQHPLGRAEWIKVAGLLFDKQDKADSIFNAVTVAYDSLTSLASEVNQKPTALTGIMYGDTWYLPGGENYAANLFKDAGISYVWKKNPENGFLQLSFETVYSAASQADLWIGTASIDELEELKNADSRYTWFESFKEGKVYTYTNQIGPTGGNMYLELGYMRPDIILADLIQIAHPTLMPERELYFYRKLK